MTVSQVADELLYTGLIEMHELDLLEGQTLGDTKALTLNTWDSGRQICLDGRIQLEFFLKVASQLNKPIRKI